MSNSKPTVFLDVFQNQPATLEAVDLDLRRVLADVKAIKRRSEPSRRDKFTAIVVAIEMALLLVDREIES